MTKYSFPAKSRAAMIDYVCEGRKGREYSYVPYPLIWNVKTRSANWQHPKGEYTVDSSLDKAWQEHMDQDDYFCSFVFESVGDYYLREWCSYPGNDQGDWDLGFQGRSGGWLFIQEWRGHSIPRMDLQDLREWLGELSFGDLKAFYRGVVCMDHDFTPQNASANIECEVNHLRHEWELEQKALVEASNVAFAEAYEDSRPDMYLAN